MTHSAQLTKSHNVTFPIITQQIYDHDITQYIMLSYRFNMRLLQFSHIGINQVMHTQAYSTNNHKDAVDTFYSYLVQ